MDYTNEIAGAATENDFYSRQQARIARRRMIAEREAKRESMFWQIAISTLGVVLLWLSMVYAGL